MNCPTCNTPLNDLRPVVPGQTLEVGDGIVCPCGALLAVEAEDKVRLLTQDEIAEMSTEETADMEFAARNIAGIQAQREGQ